MKKTALTLLLLFALLVAGTRAAMAGWESFFDQDGNLLPEVIDLGEQKRQADWMPQLPDWAPDWADSLTQATYHAYALPSGETVLLPTTSTLFFMALNPKESGLIGREGEFFSSVLAMNVQGAGQILGGNATGKDLVKGIFELLNLPYTDELADAAINGEDAWSTYLKKDAQNIFGILRDAMTADKHNLYLVALLYGNCEASPVGCPPELLAAMNPPGKTQVGSPSAPRCPAPKVTQGQITGVASKTAPNYALVTGQDPDKRGVDLQFTLTIAPTVLEYYTLEKTSSKLCISPSGSIVDTPPPVEKNCLPPNRYEEKETEECVQHTRTFCEQARGIRATASLKQSSRDWITGELAEWYTGAHLIQPDWLWRQDQGQGGCDGSNTYRWTLTLPRVQVRDPGFYGMKITGETLGTPVSSPRLIDQPAGEFDVYLMMTSLIK
ncbi:hypothetical protein ATHL_01011 [Anaerolinea thermolimosa]|uniref:hypothetical protein n=1 Tax=Anaerolinea thermolimosa TaxID=229919 RepID=UPI000782079A|nr:hypothetical protein [Anaerolinea thermolimosa]GAP06165.1 hypothetical protein ATHL_01011 [Anaerolinea thermolimosa]